MDLLTDRPLDDRQRLAADVGREATRRRSEVLHCFAQWLQAQPCGQGAPPWVQRDPTPPALAAAPAAPRAAGTTPRLPAHREPAVPPPPPTTAPTVASTGGGMPGDAPTSGR